MEELILVQLRAPRGVNLETMPLGDRNPDTKGRLYDSSHMKCLE